MVRNQSRKTYWNHIAKLANSKSELEKVNEQIQYYASLGVSDYFLNYNVKKDTKKINQIRPVLEKKGFALKDETSGIKGQAVLHISWKNATEDYAKTVYLVSDFHYKMRKLQEKLYPKIEKVAGTGEYSIQYDLTTAGIGELNEELLAEIKEYLENLNEFSSVSIIDKALILEWRI